MKNLYAKPQFNAFWPSVILWSLAWVIIFTNFAYINWNSQRLINQAQGTMLQAKLMAQANMRAESLQLTLDQRKPTYTQKEIESYIGVIFGKESKVAIAVSRHECGPTNKDYPRCVNHSDVEYSVGLFQINLYNKDHWVHASKVPGKTMDEKAEWLKDPMNNTLIANKIYKDWNNFNSWSAYTNGSYKLSMKGGE